MAESRRDVLRIGLTGGIASGKSLVAEIFAELGVPIIDTDEVARQVSAPGQPALAEIEAEFGADILTPDGQLDRAALRDIVFRDDAKRRRLEAILHPRIGEMTLEALDAAGGPYQIVVVPLLVESDFGQHVDRILVVDADESKQRQRLRTRDRESLEQAERMIAAQSGRSQRLQAADDVVNNSGTRAATRQQVEALHEKYLGICDRASGRAE